MAFWPKKTDEPAATAANGTASSASPAMSPPPAPTSLPHNLALPSDPTAPGAVPQAAAPQLSPEQRQEAAMASKLMMAGFGEIISVLMRSLEHRQRPIAALDDLAVPAVLTGQFSVAQAQSAANGLTSPIGVIFWARVSPEVDQRLTASIATEPVHLKTADWRSGPILWIVDAVGEAKVIEAMLSRLVETEWKDKEVRMRARAKDGSFSVGVLRRSTAGTAPAS